jgi:hypothetical protein
MLECEFLEHIGCQKMWRILSAESCDPELRILIHWLAFAGLQLSIHALALAGAGIFKRTFMEGQQHPIHVVELGFILIVQNPTPFAGKMPIFATA